MSPRATARAASVTTQTTASSCRSSTSTGDSTLPNRTLFCFLDLASEPATGSRTAFKMTSVRIVLEPAPVASQPDVDSLGVGRPRDDQRVANDENATYVAKEVLNKISSSSRLPVIPYSNATAVH